VKVGRRNVIVSEVLSWKLEDKPGATEIREARDGAFGREYIVFSQF